MAGKQTNSKEVVDIKKVTEKMNKVKADNMADTNDFPKLKKTFTYKKSTVIKAGDLVL